MHDDEDDGPSSLPEPRSSRAGLTLTPETRLDRAIQDRIGRELRKLHDEVLHEPVPEKLLALLKRPGKLH
jgi:Anti-sigma factor NepR